MAKQIFERTPDGSQLIVDNNLKVEKTLFIPVFDDEPTINDNPNAAGAIGMKDGKITGYDGTDWHAVLDSGDLDDETTARTNADNALQTNINGKQNTLGFTPENVANKNVASGYAGLDGSGKIAAAQLPSYVDDILEYANFAALPGTGETGKIYITLNTNLEYRWGGSSYIQLVASPGSTDAVPEGSTNLYFTVARVLAAVLTGIGFGSATAITATDTILIAFGKLQAQISNRVDMGSSYSNPAWILSLAWSKLTGTPSTLSGYGVSDVSTNFVAVTGTAGAGLVSLIGQSAPPTPPSVGTQNVYADASGRFTIMGSNGFAASLSKSGFTGSHIFILPDLDDTLVGSSAVQTLSNKSITKRVLPFATNAGTYAVNTDLYDEVNITAQTATITGFTMSGTPTDGRTLIISITGTANVPFTLGSSFEGSGGVALSNTTTGTAKLTMGFRWNTETSKWTQIAVS